MDQIKFLTHDTTFQNFEKIVQSGFLYTARERNKLGINAYGLNAPENQKPRKEKVDLNEFPGLFMN